MEGQKINQVIQNSDDLELPKHRNIYITVVFECAVPIYYLELTLKFNFFVIYLMHVW